MLTKEELQAGLSQFTEVDGWYQHWLNKFVFTDGVKWLCEQAQCRWVLNEIALYQVKIKIDHPQLEPFQIWQLSRFSENFLVLECKGSPRQSPLFSKKFRAGQFVLDQTTVWLVNGILMLPSEYLGRKGCNTA